MKKQLLLHVTFLSMFGINSFAYDIEVANSDGITIYYNYINNGQELEVTGKFWTDGYGGWHNSGYDNISTLVIPKEVNYMGRTRKVTSIGHQAFFDYPNLTSITIPNSVTNIGNQAFWCCKGLTSITIPNSVTNIGYEAFCNCIGLTSVHISDLEAWFKITFNNSYSNPLGCARHLFLNGIEIRDLVIPNSVTSIGDYAFEDCTGLTSVTIGNSVTSIEGSAFYQCVGLTSIIIPNSVMSIGDYAFWRCNGLTSVTIGNSVTNIGKYAFRDCSSLTSVTIGNSVTSIGGGAFWGCDIIEVISKIMNPHNIGATTFSQNTFYNATLYVPQGTKDKYTSTEGWKDFVWIEEGTPAGINNIKQEIPFIDHYYNLNGQENVQSRKGINILKMSNGKTKKVFVK